MKVAVYFGSRAIYYDMVAAHKSLIANSDVDKVYLLIEDDEFPFEVHPVVETINISGLVPKLFKTDSPNYGSAWTYIGLIRAALPKVFPQYDRILSIDCDTVVIKDVSDLWDIHLDEYYFAGVKEPVISRARDMEYFNAGVIMLNLEKMRQDGIDDQMIYLLNTRHYALVAQDVLNETCQGHMLELPCKYNDSAYTGRSNAECCIRHFAGGQPRHWRNLDDATKYRNMRMESLRV